MGKKKDTKKEIQKETRSRAKSRISVVILKAILYFFNLIFVLGGLAVLAVGIWIYIETNTYNALLGTDLYLNTSYVLMGAGGVVVIIAGLGCCGTSKENKCLLLTYFLFLFVIFVVELGAGIAAVVYQDDASRVIEDAMKSTLLNDFDDNGDNPVTKAWNEIQKTFDCCGVKGNNSDTSWKLWQTSAWFNNLDVKDRYVPDSCCSTESLVLCRNNQTNSHKYLEGCYDSFFDFVMDHVIVVAGVGIGVACVQLFGMMFAICLYRKVS